MAIPYEARLIACARCNNRHAEGAACADARPRSDSRRPLSAFAVTPSPGSATRSHVQPTEGRSELADDRWDDAPAAPTTPTSGAPPSLSKPAAAAPAMPSFETSDSDPGTLMYGRAADGSIRVRNAVASDAPVPVSDAPAPLGKTLSASLPAPPDPPPIAAPTTESPAKRSTPRGTLHFGPGTFAATPAPALAPAPAPTASAIVAAPVPTAFQASSETVPPDERVTMGETLTFHRNTNGGIAVRATDAAKPVAPLVPTPAPVVTPQPAARAVDTTPFGATLSYAPLDVSPDLRANAPPVASPFSSPSHPIVQPPTSAPTPESPAVVRRFPPLRALTLTGVNARGSTALPLALMLRTVGITLVIVALPVARVGRGEALALALFGLAFVAASFAQRNPR